MTRRIALERSAPVSGNAGYLGVLRFYVRVSASEDMPDTAVFIYKRSIIGAVIEDEFQAVASAVDMVEHPLDEPYANSIYFRKDYVDAYLRSTTEMEELWNVIQREVCILIESLNRMDNLQVVETSWCPSAPPADSSDSSDSSEA